MHEKCEVSPSSTHPENITEEVADSRLAEVAVSALSLASKRGSPNNPYFVLRGRIIPVDLLPRTGNEERIQITSKRIRS